MCELIHAKQIFVRIKIIHAEINIIICELIHAKQTFSQNVD